MNDIFFFNSITSKMALHHMELYVLYVSKSRPYMLYIQINKLKINNAARYKKGDLNPGCSEVIIYTCQSTVEIFIS